MPRISVRTARVTVTHAGRQEHLDPGGDAGAVDEVLEHSQRDAHRALAPGRATAVASSAGSTVWTLT
jgi:hypothetical protein